MAIDTVTIQGWLLDHAATVLGAPAVLAYEPRSRIDYAGIGSPTVAAGWLGRISALPSRGGLASTSARINWSLALYRNAIGDPAAMAATERAALTAVDAIIAAYFANIQIAADAWFDPKGQTGDAVAAEPGYLTIDNQLNRVTVITVGIVVDGAWTEVL